MKNKITYIHISILFAIVLAFIIFLRANGYFFGSNVDWLSQHTVIPDYFRRLFYSNGNIFPQFATNLGMGQNIFYFSYYGFLSPIILISYLLPYISMTSFIQIISVLMLIYGIFLIYKWMISKYPSRIAFIITLIYTLLSPILYHSHRHIMFVVYLPFLINTLIAIDNYFINKKSIPIVINIFLIIMTSYFFAPSSLIVVGVYTIYKILQNNIKISFSNFKPLFKIIYFSIIAILLSAILIVPTIYIIIMGRPDTNVTVNLLELLIPKISYSTSFYYSYSAMGFSFIYIVSLIAYILKKKKENIFLSIVLITILIFPIINYTLNAFMYVDGKSYLAFIPLGLLVIADFLNDLFKHKYKIKKQLVLLIPTIIFMLYSVAGYSYTYLLLIDIPLLIFFLIIIERYKKPNLIFIPIIIISSISFICMNKGDSYAKVTARADTQSYEEIMSYINDTSVYRTSDYGYLLSNVNQIYNVNQLSPSIYSSTSNKHFFNFSRNIFQNEIINRDNLTVTSPSNILFNFYSGVKYIATYDAPLKGYDLIKQINGLSLYENNSVLPIGYSTDKIMSLREFKTLKYPYTLDALLNYVIVNKSIDNVYISNINKYKTDYQITEMNNLSYDISQKTLYIDAQDNASARLKLSRSLNTDDILIIKFTMKHPKNGYACSSNITINNVTNALSCSDWKYFNNNYTFEYVLSNNSNIDYLDIKLSEAVYEISDIELYTINYNKVKSIKNNVSELILKNSNKSNTVFEGTIDVKKDGYLKLTIPYEKNGFEIYVDNQLTNYEMVDEAFIGFKITTGTHNIVIKYQPPFFNVGILLSLLGCLLFGLLIIYKHIKKHVLNIYLFIKKYLNWLRKKVWRLLKKNSSYSYLFASLFILDISLRIFYNKSINFYHWYYLVPNMFSIILILFILVIVKNIKNTLGKTFYLLFYIFSLLLFLVHAIYYSYFKIFFDYSILSLAGEGLQYIVAVVKNTPYWVIIVTLISVFLTIKGLKKVNFNEKTNILKLGISISAIILIHAGLPIFLGSQNHDIVWDEWRNPRNIYNTFNDNNKSMMVSGMYEYNFRNIYVNFLRDNTQLTEKEEEALNNNFSINDLNTVNEYTGIFQGKNIMFVQLESIDDFLVQKKIMPTLYDLQNNSINFTSHYSFTSGGGSTFNSEFMVNTGYSTSYNYNASAYLFSRNTYTYSLPNLFKSLDYTTKAYHMNNAEYYSRGVNYKAFGYDKYYSLKDQKTYTDNTFWLDTELIKNETFYKQIFNTSKPSLSYLITYSAHMPYDTNKGTCSLLTDKTGLTEYQCLKIQAKETDDFLKLLIAELKINNMIDNTVLVIYADHYDYTLEDKSILEKYKDTDSNLINHTPFIIWSNGLVKKTIKQVSSQLDILPTILNLFAIDYYPNNYIGQDILSKTYNPIVFFSDGSWYNGSTYVANGEYQFGKKISQDKLNKNNLYVKNKMNLNDAVLKSDYFKKK